MFSDAKVNNVRFYRYFNKYISPFLDHFWNIMENVIEEEKISVEIYADKVFAGRVERLNIEKLMD